MFGLMKVVNHQLHDLAMVKSHSRRERERERVINLWTVK
jgi:hypothetical protein